MNRKLPSAWIFAVINSTRGELAGISDGTNAVASFSYDAAGRRTNRANANGTHTVTSYDAAGQTLSIEHLQGTNVIASLGYGYNTGGNRTNRVENGIADTYTYDAIDQITGVNYSTNRTVSYGYDSLGSRTNVTDNSVPTAYTANSLNQYTAVGGASLGYDANGNLTSGPGSATYNYDGNNRLISATVGTNSATFSHDVRMRNVKRVVNGQTRYFYFDGWSLVQERDGAGNMIQNYVNGPWIDEIVSKTDSSNTIYYHIDALGSAVALTDHTCDVVERYTYDVSGTPTIFDSLFTILTSSLQDNRFLFTGREWISELGSYDYRNRIYSPELGRFLQVDPIRFSAEDANLYRYASNNPINRLDPLGLKDNCTDCDGKPKQGNVIAMRCCMSSKPMKNSDPSPYEDSNYELFWTNADSMFKRTGDFPWSDAVRGCLACMYKHGAGPEISHVFCYIDESIRNPGGTPEGIGDAIGTLIGIHIYY